MTALGQSNVNQSERENSEQAEGRSIDCKSVFTLLHREWTEQRGISPSCSSLAF